jgi:hypothetical protein
MLKFNRTKTTIEKFVDGIMDFIPDIRLVPIENQNKSPRGVCLAASGNGNEHVQIRKIGVLTDPEQSLIARIIENKKKNEYQIFFMSDDPNRLQYSILSAPNSGRFFVIDENEIATIPKSTNINPMVDELVISFAKEQFKVDLNGKNINIITGEQGNRLEIDYDSEQKYLNCKLFQNTSSGEINLKKMLLYSRDENEKYIRLVPVVHNQAVIPIPQSFKGKFIICLFH